PPTTQRFPYTTLFRSSNRKSFAPPRGYCAARATRLSERTAKAASSRCPTTSKLPPLRFWKTASVGPLMELGAPSQTRAAGAGLRSEEHTSELQSRFDL